MGNLSGMSCVAGFVRARRLALFLLVLVYILLGIVWAVGPTTPAWQGRDVYYWMFQARSSDLASNPGLAAIGSNAVPYLAHALGMKRTLYDRFAFVRSPSAQSILKLAHAGPFWSMPSKQIRYAATWSLLEFGFESKPALAQLHGELLNPQAADRQMVIACLSELGPLPESIPILVQAWPLTTNETYNIRHDLLHTLGNAGSNAATLALPIVLSALEDPVTDVRIMAAEALERWAVPAPHAAKILLPLLSSTNIALATSALGALGCVTNRCAEALPYARELLHSTNHYSRAVAAITLWRLGGSAEEARLVLESLLNGERRGTAAKYLGSMRTEAEESVPALLRASQSARPGATDMYARGQCAKAVLKIHGPSSEAFSALAEALACPSNSWIRANIAEEIGRLGNLGVPLIPAIEVALKDPDREVRHEAAASLAKLRAFSQKP